MRAAILAAALLPALAVSALADTYALTDGQGHRQCIVYDGRSPYAPPPGWTLSAQPNPSCAVIDADDPAR